MADVICMSCGEPWEAEYLNHDGLYDDVDVHKAPADVVAEHLAFLDEEGDTIGYPTHLYRAVVSGSGCPACDWSKADGSRFDEALSLALDSANFDGDPLDLLESFI